ncbi:Cystathionine beta-synthase [Smittium mucronatum]|uniref:Cystathionine beta-synthase n=1 Tax=Smittium mucronatum TaxID=133383 RepID=A0A1R0H6L1_9FUNG|nr:Cystathionine beta-synthase [Smittium mucronatum]
MQMPQTGSLNILNDISEFTGNTPLVRLNSIPQSEGIKCEMLAKCEFFNPGGSAKDRIAKRMIEEAERAGTLKPGYTIIEPTSGNTGIGLALSAAIKGYRCIITLPEKMSQEKVDVLKALGAEIIRTPTEAAWDSPDSHIGVANRLLHEIPNSVILNQYDNPFNPIAHYETTAKEILDACNGRVDMIVVGAGTGGTITGISRRVKEQCPQCIVVGVDPIGSVLAQPESLNIDGGSYKVEGIGYDFIPKSLERDAVDYWIKSSDKPSFIMARRLIREEGLLCGGSSGTAMYAAIQAASVLEPGQRCVVILPDGVRNYMTKFLNDKWMISNGFLEDTEAPKSSVQKKPVAGLTVKDLGLKKAITVYTSTPAQEASRIMLDLGFDQLPVISSSGHLKGIVTLGNIVSRVASGASLPSSLVSEVMYRFPITNGSKFKEINVDTPLDYLTEFFQKNNAAIITERISVSDSGIAFKPIHVLTGTDLLSYLLSHKAVF